MEIKEINKQIDKKSEIMSWLKAFSNDEDYQSKLSELNSCFIAAYEEILYNWVYEELQKTKNRNKKK